MEREIMDTTYTARSVSFLDLHLEIHIDGTVTAKTGHHDIAEILLKVASKSNLFNDYTSLLSW
jgi:hypothetical protein